MGLYGTMSKQHILIVDDEKDTRDLMARALSAYYNVTTAADAEMAIKKIEENPSIVLMLSDIRMPGADGMQLLQAAKKIRPNLICILLTAFGTVDQAVAAMKQGAEDFLMKPIDLDQLDLRIEKVLKTGALENEVASLKSQLDEKYSLEKITGSSDVMKGVFNLVKLVAPTEATVLIQGPSGTGKELVAHAIHNLSGRSKGPFIAVHCAALTENLLESELFGHEKGAFTGAMARQIGRFEAANNGTIFLDEISEITPQTQVKLLRVLEDRSFQRVGSTETLHTNIRIIAATNRDLKKYVEEGKFREDLYYRLNIVDIHLPALKDRTGDIPLIASRYLKEFSAANGEKVTGITPAAMKALEKYEWPGNVRELRNAMEKMVVLSPGGMIDIVDIPEHIRNASHDTPTLPAGTLEETERAKILAALKNAGGNKTLAAESLGISRRTLYRKLDEYAKEGFIQ
jgi:DNA-binding NtrC family response regulator